jgi:hypothetical protein
MMGQLFSSPKTKIPVLPEPEAEPMPELSVDDDKGKRKRYKGRSETIITGELEPVTNKKTLLG